MLAELRDYSAPDRGAKYCDERVCLFVCPQSYLLDCMSNLHQIFVHVAYGRGSVLLWRRSVLFFSRPRSEGWPHHGRTFSIYPCPLSF